MTLNALVGLPYRFGASPESGATDCWHLVCHVLRANGADPPNFEWVFEQPESSLTPEQIQTWVEQETSPADTPQHLDLLVVPTELVAFGIVHHDHVYYISAGGRVVCKPLTRLSRSVSFCRLRSLSAAS